MVETVGRSAGTALVNQINGGQRRTCKRVAIGVGLSVLYTSITALLLAYSVSTTSTTFVEIMNAMILLASLGILTVGIFAALYVKPGFDAWRSSQVHPPFSLQEVRVTDDMDRPLLEYVPSQWPDPGSQHLQFSSCRSGDGSSTLKVYARVKNDGQQAASWLFNFVVYKSCELEVLDPPAKNHYLNPGEIHSDELISGTRALARRSVAHGELPPQMSVSLAIKVKLPAHGAPCGPDHWPLRLRLTPFLMDRPYAGEAIELNWIAIAPPWVRTSSTPRRRPVKRAIQLCFPSIEASTSSVSSHHPLGKSWKRLERFSGWFKRS